MFGGVEGHGTCIVENGPEGTGGLQLFAHLFEGLGHGVGIQQVILIELVEELQAFHIGAAFGKTVIIFTVGGVDVADTQLIIAVISSGKGLHIHYHAAVPIGPDRNGICFVAVFIGGADGLHLLEYFQQAVQVLHGRIAQFFIQIPAQVPGVEEGLVSAFCGCHVETKAVNLVISVILAVGLQGSSVIFGNVGGPGLHQVIFFPIQQHALVHSVLIIFAVGTPDNDITQIAAFHASFIGAVRVGNDVDLHVEFVFQQRGAPAALHAGIVRQLAVNGEGDGAVFPGEDVKNAFRKSGAGAKEHDNGHHKRQNTGAFFHGENSFQNVVTY